MSTFSKQLTLIEKRRISTDDAIRNLIIKREFQGFKKARAIKVVLLINGALIVLPRIPLPIIKFVASKTTKYMKFNGQFELDKASYKQLIKDLRYLGRGLLLNIEADHGTFGMQVWLT